jgi:L-cysteine S-thiosulfotransferase
MKRLEFCKSQRPLILRCFRESENVEGRTTLVRAAVLSLLMTLALPAAADGIPPADRRSGFEQMGPETQGMQRDDTLNPAMLWVAEGRRFWSADPGTGKPSCAGCHGSAEEGMKGVAAAYPKIDEATGRPIDLMGRIQQCRTERQSADPLGRESRPLLGLASHVGLQSRGAEIAPSTDPRLAPFRDEGRKLFTARLGQLNLSCAQCHDERWGQRLAGNAIPQGHPNGYPLYRLEWQGVGSLQRRLRGCFTGIRAEPFAYGDPALVNLEIYLRERAAGLTMEIPGVRP